MPKTAGTSNKRREIYVRILHVDTYILAHVNTCIHTDKLRAMNVRCKSDCMHTVKKVFRDHSVERFVQRHQDTGSQDESWWGLPIGSIVVPFWDYLIGF